MPILSTVGRKARRMRVILATLYVVLILGSLTMVYPFLLMISNSFASYVDRNDFRIIPLYWHNDEMLFRKYVEAKYNENVNYWNQFLGRNDATFADLKKPAPVNARAVADWQEFTRSLKPEYTDLANQDQVSHITPECLYRYRVFLQTRFKGDCEAMNRLYEEAHDGWGDGSITLPADRLEERQTRILDTPKYRDFLRFKQGLLARYRIPVGMDGTWWTWLGSQYGNELKTISARHGLAYASAADVHLAERLPATPNLAEDWVRYVRREIPFHYLELDPAAAPAFRRALQQRYGTADGLNRAYKSGYADWSQVPFSPSVPRDETRRLDWTDFVLGAAPPQYFRLRTPEVLYHESLARKYGSVAAVNQAYGTHYPSFAAVNPPRYESEWVELLANKQAIRHEFIVRNYREVFDYMAIHGRAIWNTLVLVVGLLLVTLIINPLAAYALSRYQLPGTYKILLFLLATMAFPAEVTMIPGFLLLKQLHLLNTYWAIILPAMASGYSIFLLKGFFDSLPRELYEAAQLDGAREATMFLRITVPLSKPVLAVIALGTFSFAYGAFMWAFVVCQDPKMWTLMVWLFQMNTWSPQFVQMAALVLSAIPTLLVFIFCQNIIMRGIILPVEK